MRAVYLALIILFVEPTVISSQTLSSETCPNPLPNQPSLPEIIACLQKLQRTTVPSGAVVAFDLPNGCPEGWSAYPEAWARFIVGAVSEDDLGKIPGDFREDARGEDLSSRLFGKPGGEEQHKLTKPEMPKHSHSLYESKREQRQDEGGGVFALAGQGNVPPYETTAQGGSEPHNNMPPYVALYYCKKD